MDAFRLKKFLNAGLRATFAVILGELFNCWGSNFPGTMYRNMWTAFFLVELMSMPINRFNVSAIYLKHMYFVIMSLFG